MFRGFVVANRSISVAVVDVDRVGSLINCVKPKVEVPVYNNFFSLSRGRVQAVVKASQIIYVRLAI